MGLPSNLMTQGGMDWQGKKHRDKDFPQKNPMVLSLSLRGGGHEKLMKVLQKEEPEAGSRDKYGVYHSLVQSHH